MKEPVFTERLINKKQIIKDIETLPTSPAKHFAFIRVIKKKLPIIPERLNGLN